MFLFTQYGIKGMAPKEAGVCRIVRAKIGRRNGRELYVGESLSLEESLLELCTGKSTLTGWLQAGGADYWECETVGDEKRRKALAEQWCRQFKPLWDEDQRALPHFGPEFDSS